MIYLTRLNRDKFCLNSDLIETVENTPDTVITMLNGKKYIVSETLDDVVGRIVDFRRKQWDLSHVTGIFKR
jgi:flagellar protein FlbD